ncbi:hypothetical protein F4677DRAFT_408475 [Hypoxylon crocopeplum]|nr:hypothetical protein F4677DRAFT_408475 [Hypoxylon crocopeplum]
MAPFTPSKARKKRGSRSRSGCWTCRIRKVKCDETRPVCRRCSSTGRTCDGYELQPMEVLEVARSTERRLCAKDLSDFRSLDGSLSLSAAEARGFDFFRRNTSREIPGFRKSDLWDRLILQLCHSEVAIRHAAVAVGVMHARYRGISPSLQVQGFVISEWQHAFAIQQYVKSLGHLRDRLSNQANSINAELALICCLLFVCLEMLQGNRIGALAHLRNGLRVLSGIPSQVNITYSSGEQLLVIRPKADSLLDQLTTAFGRLDLESTSFGERTPTLRLEIQPALRGSNLTTGEIFSSVEEAKVYLDVLHNAVLQLRGKLLRRAVSTVEDETADWAIQRCVEYATTRTVGISEDPALSGELEKVQRDLALWLNLFKSHAASQTKLHTAAAAKSAILLEIQHFFIFFQAMTCRETTEISCDRFQALFNTTTSLIADIASTPDVTFTIDTGVIPSLCLIALKCRVPDTRRLAISMLYKRACQEGMWEGTLIAKFVEQAVIWEEELAGQCLEAHNMLPEYARFCDVTFAASEDPGFGRIVSARYLHESSGELMIFERIFKLL